ncbi:hypothetical protein BCR32DRAFT_294980 [Anaeromyces robustus]|uniref:tRNA ligase n=1 Tax=Anaeromyces robustus TaxID=1754192 RepID=A0A1Y1WZD0_9FUNG|nr:hypothetical protein BCR32DRAFT_294980 [Anaeromyces robustus]|eukprot:ORX78536.1 hypothetical protein BCR32DRAFT_294980 [Anaeromyces robustus]
MEKIIDFRDKSKQYPRLFKISKFTLPKSKRIIESFNIQECAFKRNDIVPFSARGVFVLPTDNTIVARGYNKFFNINETEETQWNNIREKTVGPYELTLKENGCIIFVSVLDDDLLVTSKHSTTKIDAEGNLIHNKFSDLGEKWLYKYIGDKKQELIDFIKENKITLVFELVDNDFEEHVIEYSKEEDGLYLHGINENTVEFNSWPSEKVFEIAKRFNFISVKYMVYDNIDDLKKFADDCNGYYNGKAIEGWVVRCKKDNGQNFFFKYKYNEPYLLYREWREATSAYLAHRPMKYKYIKTYGYVEWIKEKYQSNKELFAKFNEKKGIIKLRNLYLEETNGGEYVPKVQEPVTKENARYKLILPISIIGSGKTTVGRMLKILYDIGHIQSDNIQKKKPAPEFIENVCKEFDTKTIVMADKNNHLKMHRNDLCKKLKSIYPNSLWIVALYWNIETVPEKDVLEFSRDRIERRGENHQNLTPEKTSNYPFIVKMFLNNFEFLDISDPEDSLIDETIEIKFKEDSISIVKKIIESLNLEPKTDEELKAAYIQANEIKPEVSQKPRKLAPLYYGLRLKYVNCKDIALKYLKNYSDQNEQFVKDYEKVKFLIENSNFLQREHITIAFRKRDPPEMIKYYDQLVGQGNQVANFNDPKLEVFINVSSIVWTSNLVFMPVDEIESDKIWEKIKKEDNKENQNNEDKNENKINKKYDDSLLCHITLASYGDTKPIDCLKVLNDIKNYYDEHTDLKLENDTKKTEPTIVDESYIIDETNKEIENEIIHPSSIIQLLAPPIKNVTFIKPLKIVEGPNWKQLFFEPFKFKGYYTKFFY